MLLFPQYRLSEKAAARHVLTVRAMGLVPIFVALLLMLARHNTPGPGLWSALGLAVGLEILLWGCHGICFERNLQSKPCTYMALTCDTWFPLFLFSVQGLFLLLTAALLWLTFHDLGFPATAGQHVILVILVLMIPLCRATGEAARASGRRSWSVASGACRCAGTVLATYWLARTITLFMAPPGRPLPPDLFPIAVILWVVTALAILVATMVFADHVRQSKR